MNQNFIHQLIKGKITEVIFQHMFAENGEYTIIPLGYEKTLPELAQYQHLIEVRSVMDNIRSAPDFLLIDRTKTKVFLVEVKFRSSIDTNEIAKISTELLQRWNPSHLFAATKDNFYFDSCNSILNQDGEIGLLSNKWVDKNIQEQYLIELRKFINS